MRNGDVRKNQIKVRLDKNKDNDAHKDKDKMKKNEDVI